MTFLLLLGALIILLYLGMPMYAGMFLFSLVVLLLVEGKVAGVGEMAFGKLNVFLLAAIPLFMLMARFMVKGRVVDDLYKTALGDYMSAKYTLADSEFGDVIRYYADNPLAGNAYYYQAEIAYRGGHYDDAIKAYDNVITKYPASNKVPVSRLHKGQALIALKQKDAGVRELRGLIQRFPTSPEAMQARSRLSGMGVPVTPRR